MISALRAIQTPFPDRAVRMAIGNGSVDMPCARLPVCIDERTGDLFGSGVRIDVHCPPETWQPAPSLMFRSTLLTGIVRLSPKRALRGRSFEVESKGQARQEKPHRLRAGLRESSSECGGRGVVQRPQGGYGWGKGVRCRRCQSSHRSEVSSVGLCPMAERVMRARPSPAPALSICASI